MMAKYTMGLLVAGVVVGVLATEAWRFLRSGWLWAGVLVSVAIWTPNVWWQRQRGFPSLEFLRFLHTRDMSTGVTDGFLVGQLELTLLAFPLAIAGLWFYLFTKQGKPYRAIGWMYLVPLVLLVVMRGRDYYLAPAYPMLYAAGAVWIERQWRVTTGEWRERRKHSKLEIRNSEERNSGERVQGYKGVRVRLTGWMKRWLPAMLMVDAVVAGCVALPVMPVNSRWWQMAAQVDTVLPEELGWEELTETVAHIRDGLPEKDRARLGILARNYGEMGALNLYGEKHGLPRAISGVNSSWERGYGNPAPETVIAVGYSLGFLEEHFASCELAGHPWNRYGVENEERIEDPDIFVCRGLKESWDEFWKKVKLFA
jgi:4-amino-4-deoxy-L-arabinose transferase-like glycosyltransferase